MSMTSNLYLVVSGFSQAERITVSSTGTGLTEIRETIANSVSDGPLSFSGVYDEIEFLYICSTTALTLKVYDITATVTDTITLVANSPLIYKRSPLMGVNPFTEDFFTASVTNASGGPATLTIMMITDATPA